MHEKLALKIKDLIEKKNISIQGLEKKAGLKINAVRNILTGHSKKPSAETVLAIAKGLDCSINELLGEETQDPSWAQKIIFSEHDLLLKTLDQIIQAYALKKEALTAQTLLSLSHEIYTYSLQNNGGRLDHNFANWTLKKYVA